MYRAWCGTLLQCQHCSEICGPFPWDVLLTTVVWCACCPPTFWGYSLVPSYCGGTPLPTVLLVDVDCGVLYMAVVAMFLLWLVPSACRLLLVSAFFPCLLLCPPPLPSLTCNCHWSVPSSCICSTLNLWWGTSSLVVKVLLCNSSKTCTYPDFCLLQLVPSCCALTVPCIVHLHLSFELQWLLWQWHSDFALCWAAHLNCILLKLFKLHLWTSADPNFDALLIYLHILLALGHMTLLKHWSYAVPKFHAAETSLHFSMYSGRPRSPCTSCL